MRVVDLRGKLPTHKTKRYGSRKPADIRSIGIHHSLTFSGSPEAFANHHVTKNDWPGIGYAYVIGKDGTVYQCWDHTIVSYHVGDSNKHSIGICLVGDFSSQQPTTEQYEAALELVRDLQKELPSVTKVLGHSENPGYAWKACPVIPMDQFRHNLEEDELMLNPDVAITIIKTWMAGDWAKYNEKEKAARTAGDENGAKAHADQKSYINWLANELRKASGLPEE